MFLPGTFLGAYISTDKILTLYDSLGNKVGGFNICKYQKAVVSGNFLQLVLLDIKLDLEFNTPLDALQASANLLTATEVLVSNCEVVGTDKTYVHTQSSPLTTWTVNHNLSKIPSITVTDSLKEVIYADITHSSTSQAIISFSTASTGFAYCN